jgi:hypothetical protein
MNAICPVLFCDVDRNDAKAWLSGRTAIKGSTSVVNYAARPKEYSQLGQSKLEIRECVIMDMFHSVAMKVGKSFDHVR